MKRGSTMKDNRTGLLCQLCNSHIIVHEEYATLIYECSCCGTQPEDIQIDDFKRGLYEN